MGTWHSPRWYQRTCGNNWWQWGEEKLMGLSVWIKDQEILEGRNELPLNNLTHLHLFYFLLEKCHDRLSLSSLLILKILTLWSTTLWAFPFEFWSSRLDKRQLRKPNTKPWTASFSWPPALKILILFRLGECFWFSRKGSFFLTLLRY